MCYFSFGMGFCIACAYEHSFLQGVLLSFSGYVLVSGLGRIALGLGWVGLNVGFGHEERQVCFDTYTLRSLFGWDTAWLDFEEREREQLNGRGCGEYVGWDLMGCLGTPLRMLYIDIYPYFLPHGSLRSVTINLGLVLLMESYNNNPC